MLVGTDWWLILHSVLWRNSCELTQRVLGRLSKSSHRDWPSFDCNSCSHFWVKATWLAGDRTPDKYMFGLQTAFDHENTSSRRKANSSRGEVYKIHPTVKSAMVCFERLERKNRWHILAARLSALQRDTACTTRSTTLYSSSGILL